MNTDHITHDQVRSAARLTMARIIMLDLTAEEMAQLDTDEGLDVDGVAIWWNNKARTELFAFASDHEVFASMNDFAGGTIVNFHTGVDVGPATFDDFAASVVAAHDDGGRGVIEVNGRSCYVV